MDIRVLTLYFEATLFFFFFETTCIAVVLYGLVVCTAGEWFDWRVCANQSERGPRFTKLVRYTLSDDAPPNKTD